MREAGDQRGDVVITENPTFLGALIAFNPYEPTYAAVRMDDDGMDMEQIGRRWRRRTQDDLHGSGLPEPDRSHARRGTARLIELANSYEVLVVEDTPYRALRYDGEHLPIEESRHPGRVVHLGSFSKILAPGMRLGWAVANEEILPRLGLLKLAADTQTSTLNMAATSAISRDTTSRRTSPRRCCLPAQARPDVADHGGEFPFLGQLHPSRWRAVHLADLSCRLRCSEFMRAGPVAKARVAFVPGATFFPVVEEPNRPAQLLRRA